MLMIVLLIQMTMWMVDDTDVDGNVDDEVDG